MSKKGIALCFAVFLVCITIAVWAQEKTLNRVVSERLVAEIDFSTWVPESFKVSPDNRRVAYVATVGDKQSVVVDGEEVTQCDGIANPIFSPNGERMAYVGRVVNKWFVVVDGEEGKQYDGIADPIFSPNSKRVAYGAKSATSGM